MLVTVGRHLATHQPAEAAGWALSLSRSTALLRSAIASVNSRRFACSKPRSRYAQASCGSGCPTVPSREAAFSRQVTAMSQRRVAMESEPHSRHVLASCGASDLPPRLWSLSVGGLFRRTSRPCRGRPGHARNHCPSNRRWRDGSRPAQIGFTDRCSAVGDGLGVTALLRQGLPSQAVSPPRNPGPGRSPDRSPGWRISGRCSPGKPSRVRTTHRRTSGSARRIAVNSAIASSNRFSSSKVHACDSFVSSTNFRVVVDGP